MTAGKQEFQLQSLKILLHEKNNINRELYSRLYVALLRLAWQGAKPAGS